MRVRSPRLLFAHVLGVGLTLGVGVPRPARGQVPEKRELSEPAGFVFGSLQCPDPKTVQQAVLSLIPPERHALLEEGVRIELEDLGDSYRVTVWKAGRSVKKSYSDPARECDGRARFAAVFSVLTLMPPELGADPLAKPEPEPAPVPVSKPAPEPARIVEPAPAPPRPPFVHLELSAVYSSAPAILDSPSMYSFGGELRLSLGAGALSGTLSAAYLERARFDARGVQGEVERLPLSVGARLRSDFEAWRLSAELGLLLVPQRVRATNLLSQHADRSVDLGLRAGVQLARQSSAHFAPFVGAFACFSPAPSQLAALPQGVIGNLPYLWLGGAVGVSFGL